MIDCEVLATRIQHIAGLGLLSPQEASEANAVGMACFPLADAFRLADSIHLNVKVGRVDDKYATWAGTNQAREENAMASRERAHSRITSALTYDRKRNACVIYSMRFRSLHRNRVGPIYRKGGPGKGVFCCHVQVTAKHWVYPNGSRSVPLEFAFGPLIMNEAQSGCDLRPANPNLHAGQTIPSRCCGS